MNTNLAKCGCGHCDGHIEFDAAYAGERVACPHCGRETRLYIPGTAIPPPIPSPPPTPTAPAVQPACRLADPTGPRTPPPRPPVIPLRDAPPRNPNSFARQAARASWISFIFAYGFAAMLRGLKGTPQYPFVLVTAPLFALLGVTFGVIGLRGIRKHGKKGILIPAVVGIVLNGAMLSMALLGVVKGLNDRHHLQETKHQVAAGLEVYLGQLKSGVPVKRMPPTGDAEMDAGFRIMVDLNNELDAVIERMDTKLAQLKETDVCLVLTNKAAIKSELGKRTSAQAIVQEGQREAAAIFESAKQRCHALRIPEHMKQTVLHALDNGGQAQAILNEVFSLRARLRNTEFELLQFMHREFGRYRIIGGDARFAAATNQAEYARLSQRVQDVLNDAEAFDRRRSELLEAMPDQIKQLTK